MRISRGHNLPIGLNGDGVDPAISPELREDCSISTGVDFSAAIWLVPSERKIIIRRKIVRPCHNDFAIRLDRQSTSKIPAAEIG